MYRHLAFFELSQGTCHHAQNCTHLQTQLLIVHALCIWSLVALSFGGN